MPKFATRLDECHYRGSISAFYQLCCAKPASAGSATVKSPTRVTVKPEMVAFEPNGVWSNITRHQGKIINELSTVIVSPASGAVKSSSN
jgi:hypothetical protein